MGVAMTVDIEEAYETLDSQVEGLVHGMAGVDYDLYTAFPPEDLSEVDVPEGWRMYVPNGHDLAFEKIDEEDEFVEEVREAAKETFDSVMVVDDDEYGDYDIAVITGVSTNVRYDASFFEEFSEHLAYVNTVTEEEIEEHYENDPRRWEHQDLVRFSLDRPEE